MIIEINDTKTIAEIRDLFSGYYPFLKLEFFDVPHEWQEASLSRNQLPPDRLIGEVRKRHAPGALEIRSSDKTGNVEQDFYRHFGLNVQVFRHHGNIWIQTAGTDELTLAEQNEIGRKATIDYLHVADSRTEVENLY